MNFFALTILPFSVFSLRTVKSKYGEESTWFYVYISFQGCTQIRVVCVWVFGQMCGVQIGSVCHFIKEWATGKRLNVKFIILFAYTLFQNNHVVWVILSVLLKRICFVVVPITSGSGDNKLAYQSRNFKFYFRCHKTHSFVTRSFIINRWILGNLGERFK